MIICITASDKLLEQFASELFDFGTITMIHSDAGLIELMDRFYAPEELQKFLEIHETMDRAVLNAYGWKDPALSARCEFLPPQGVKQPRFFRRSMQDEKGIRLRWTDEFSQRVLERLLAIADFAGE